MFSKDIFAPADVKHPSFLRLFVQDGHFRLAYHINELQKFGTHVSRQILPTECSEWVRLVVPTSHVVPLNLNVRRN